MAAWQVVPKPELPARPPLWDPRLLWMTLALVAIILVGALVLLWLDRWRRRPDVPIVTANDQLAHFRELYECGELSQEEFDRIRAKLTGQMRKELNVPAGPPKDEAAVQPPPPQSQEPGNPPASPPAAN
jgi:hypothetical protein